MTKTLILYLNQNNVAEIGAVHFFYNEMKKVGNLVEKQDDQQNKVIQYSDGDTITLASVATVSQLEKFDFVYIPASTSQALFQVAKKFIKKTQFTDVNNAIKQFAVVDGQIYVV